MDYEINKIKYLALIGHVQSGKTYEEINYCFTSVNVHKIPVIFILRNINADQLQLYTRMNTLKQNLNVKLLNHLTIPDGVAFMESTGIILMLCNVFQLDKIKELLKIYKGDYNLCIDEVDFSIKTRDHTSCIDCYMNDLKMGANHILGATATPFSLFLSEGDISKFKKIKEGHNYHGISSLKLRFINPKIDIKNFPYCDSVTINTVYTELLTREHCILLHTVVKEKVLQYRLGEYINKLFPQFTTIIYNGDGILVNSTQPIGLIPPKSVNSYGQIINKYYSLPHGHLFINYSISEVLQILKGHCHISIIAGHLASRGISFVSSDYSIHLTDQYFHAGKSSHGENLLQSLRILGCYKKTSTLTLWCNQQTWRDIIEQNNIIDKLIHSCNDSKEWFVKIQEVIVSKPKRQLTRPKLNIGINWKLDKLELI
jgi:hypothetical protein